MPTITEKQIFKKIKEASWRVVDNDGVVLDLKTGAYYSLNPVGLRIWQFCDGKRNLKTIGDLISKEYGVSEKKAGSDVQKFIGELRKHKLIEAVS